MPKIAVLSKDSAASIMNISIKVFLKLFFTKKEDPHIDLE